MISNHPLTLTEGVCPGGGRPPAEIPWPRAALFWLLGVLLFPLLNFDLVDPTGMEKVEGITSNKIIRVVHLFILFGVLAFAGRSRGGDRTAIHEPRASRLLLFVALAECASIGLSWATGQEQTWNGAYYVVARIVIILCSLKIARHALRHLSVEFIARSVAWWLTLFSVCLLAASGLLAVFHPDLGYSVFDNARGGRLGGFFIHPNNLSAYFALGILSFFYLKQHSAFGRTVPHVLVVLCLAAGIVLTQSRVSAFAIAVAAPLLLMARHGARSVWLRRLMVSATVAAIVSTAGFVLSDVSSADATGSAEDRQKIYVAAMTGIWETPFTGVGYYDGVQQYLNDSISGQIHIRVVSSHNMLLDLLLSRGLVLGASFLLLFFLVGRASLAAGWRAAASPAMTYLGACATFLLIHGMACASATNICVDGPGALFYLLAFVILASLLQAPHRRPS